MSHQLFTITGNQGPRLLSQVLGLIAHRQTSLLSFNASWIGDEMRAHLLVDVPDDNGGELLTKRLNRIVDVVKTVSLSPADSHQLRAVLVWVDCDARTRGLMTDVARAFRAEIVEIGTACMTLSYAGTPSKVAELLAVLEQFGLREIADSGTVALRRRSRSASVRTLSQAAIT